MSVNSEKMKAEIPTSRRQTVGAKGCAAATPQLRSVEKGEIKMKLADIVTFGKGVKVSNLNGTSLWVRCMIFAPVWDLFHFRRSKLEDKGSVLNTVQNKISSPNVRC